MTSTLQKDQDHEQEKNEKLSPIEETKETWQINAICFLGLDSRTGKGN